MDSVMRKFETWMYQASLARSSSSTRSRNTYNAYVDCLSTLLSGCLQFGDCVVHFLLVYASPVLCNKSFIQRSIKAVNFWILSSDNLWQSITCFWCVGRCLAWNRARKATDDKYRTKANNNVAFFSISLGQLRPYLHQASHTILIVGAHRLESWLS